MAARPYTYQRPTRTVQRLARRAHPVSVVAAADRGKREADRNEERCMVSHGRNPHRGWPVCRHPMGVICRAERAQYRPRRADDFLGVAMAGKEPNSGRTWSNHRFAALCVRTVAWAAPISVSVVATALVSRAVDRPSGWLAIALWWLAMSLVATAMLIVTDRAARRLLPLAALLRLSLVFPDEAPSRFRTALRTGTVHQLEQRVAAVKRSGLPSDPTDAAETLIELVAALSAHDRLTRGHAERVRAYSRMIGEELRLDDADLERLHWAGLLHDVGKLFVPSEILNKPGALTREEFEVIKQHPGRGAELCEPLRPWLGDWVDAVGQHHERWDGRGYPAGLAAREISLAGRIVAVADAFDVMTSVRSYKAPQDAGEARAELARCAGSHFDPDVVRAFLGISLGRMRLVMGPLSWLAQAPVLGRIPVVPAAGAAVTGALTAVTLFAGGLLSNPHHDSTSVAAAPAVTALPFADRTELPSATVTPSKLSDSDRLTASSQPAAPDTTSSVFLTTSPVAEATTPVGASTTTAATPGAADVVVVVPTATVATVPRPAGGSGNATPPNSLATSTTAAPATVAPPTTAPPTTAAPTTT